MRNNTIGICIKYTYRSSAVEKTAGDASDAAVAYLVDLHGFSLGSGPMSAPVLSRGHSELAPELAA